MTKFNEFYIGLIVIVGIMGNAYCVRQLRTTNLRRYAFTWYLLALALSDTGFLVTLALLTLYNVGIDLINLPVVCQTTHFLTYICSFLSNWYILALSFERCLAVHRPLQSYTALLSGRSKIIVSMVTVFGLLVNWWTLVFFDSAAIYGASVLQSSNDTSANPNTNRTITGFEYVCHFRPSLFDYYPQINLLDLTFSCAIPLTGILVFNCLIAREFCLTNQLFRRPTNEYATNSDSLHLGESVTMVTAASSSAYPDIHVHRGRVRKKDVKITVLLLGISVTHLLLNLPSYIHRMVESFVHPMENENNSTDFDEATNSSSSTILDTIVNLIFYTQYSVNFILYSFSHGKLCFRFKRVK